MNRYNRCKDALKVKLTASFLGLPMQSHQKEKCCSFFLHFTSCINKQDSQNWIATVTKSKITNR